MKKTTSVNVKLVALVALLMAIVFSVSALLLGRSTISASAAVSDNCGYNEDNVYVDYSGQGTVINGKMASDGQAQVSGNYVNVPIYKGKYESAWYDWWIWHGWSDWSTENYYQTKQNDYENYCGETTTEYDVRDRKEYKYRRNESRDVYSTKYYTTYQGSKWYNCWIFLFTSSWSGYGGEKSGYKIVNRYTKSEKSGTKQVTVYDNEWRTSAPWSWAWENKWEAYNSRTTYSYRSREMKWNAYTNIGYEQASRYYSLTSRNGESIDYGIHLTANSIISQNSKTNLLLPCPMDWNWDIDYYYLNVEALQNQFLLAILNSQSTDEVTSYMKGLITAGTTTMSTVIGLAAQIFSTSAIVSALGAACTYAAAIILPLTLMDIFMQYQKEVSLSRLVDKLKEIDNYKYVGVCFSRYYNLNSTEFTIPIYDMEIALLDKIDNTNDDISYVSMRFDDNDAINSEISNVYRDALGLDYYGNVSYVKSLDTFSNKVQTYFNSFDIFNIFSWFGL